MAPKRRLNTLSKLRMYVSDVIHRFDNNEITAEKARTLGYLSNSMRQLLEVGELEERIEKLEEALKNRN